MPISYKDAGVDIEGADALVSRIGKLAARTRIPELIAGVGGFAGLCALPQGMSQPILVAGTDGVGTKLRVAFQTGVHNSIGIDLVAMCVNDVITTGARPLFFLDYFATGKLENSIAALVIEGIVEGCGLASCALLGGETAEMPGFYPDGEYELAGFAVGVVEKDKLLDGRHVQAGDAVIGVASSGLHSNGYSLARRVLLEHAKLSWQEPIGELSLQEWLLRPTRIYHNAVQAALQTQAVHSICHITGGGLPGNLPRVLPKELAIHLQRKAWPVPSIFTEIATRGPVSVQEMSNTFNLGIGLVLTAEAQKADEVISALQTSGETAWVIGSVLPRRSVSEDQVFFL